MPQLSRLLTVLLTCIAGSAEAGCAKPLAPVGPATPTASPDAPTPSQGLPPLTPREAELRDELAGTVQHLVREIGERNPKQHWELATAADYLAGELEGAGFAVDRQGYPIHDDAVAQNLVVQVPGGRRGNEIVIVGAHYDSPLGSPGASDATGTAALLALARSLRDFDSLRTLRFVAFATSHPRPEPGAQPQTAATGSMAYAKQLADAKEEVTAMVGLESVGYYSQRRGSQRPPAGLEGSYPDVGDFVSFVGDMRAGDLVDGMMAMFSAHASIAAQPALLVEPTDGLGTSDSWSFAQVGFPAISVTDTGELRNPLYRTAEDVVDALDFGRAARVVAGLEIALRKLAGQDQPLPDPKDLREEATQDSGGAIVAELPSLLEQASGTSAVATKARAPKVRFSMNSTRTSRRYPGR